MPKKWGRTEYIDCETGEIIWSREIKKCSYKVLETNIRLDRGYTVTRKIVKIQAKQQELWNQQ